MIRYRWVQLKDKVSKYLSKVMGHHNRFSATGGMNSVIPKENSSFDVLMMVEECCLIDAELDCEGNSVIHVIFRLMTVDL